MHVLFAFYTAGRAADGGLKSLSHIVEAALQHTSFRASFLSNAPARNRDVATVPFSSLRNTPAKSHLKILKHLLRLRPDVVHANDIFAFQHCILPARALGIPIVLNVRGLKPRQQRYGWHWRAARFGASRFIALSEDMKDSLAVRVPSPLGAGAPIVHGGSIVNLEPLEPKAKARRALAQELGFPETNRVVAHVGALRPLKAQLEHLEAWASRWPADTQLLFVGDHHAQDADYADALRRLSERSDLRDRCHLLGFRKDVPSILRAADLSVVTSRQEGLARCMLESLAQETPVVSYDVCSAHEYLSAPKLGVVIPQGDRDAMLDAILGLLDDAPRRAAMGHRARSFLESRCSAPMVAERYLAAYRAAIGGHR